MAKSTDIRAWTYEADIHCPECATKRFGPAVTEYPWPAQDVTDSEGNPPHPVFGYEEASDSGEVCGTCGTVLAEPYGDRQP